MGESNLPLALIVAAVIFTIIAIAFLIKAFIRRKRFTASTVGKIVDIKITKQHYSRRSKNGDYRSGCRTWYAPTIEYAVDGETYRSTADSVTAHGFYEKGEKIEIFYSPKNPGKVTVISPTDTKKGGLLMFGISAILLLIGLLLSLVS